MTSDARTANDEARRLLSAAVRDPAAITRFSTAELDLVLRLARRVRLLGRIGHALEADGLLDELPVAAADQLLGAVRIVGLR